MIAAVKTAVLAGARLDALDLILTGMLDPVDGYRLPGESMSGWPVTPALEVDAAVAAGDELHLQDPDGTPLALLEVDEVKQTGWGSQWVAGRLRMLRAAEHGYSRELRPTIDTDLAGRTIAIFAGGVRAADVLAAVNAAGGAGVDFVFVGRSDAPATAEAMGDLQKSAAQLLDARVFFLPDVDLGSGEDVAAMIVRRLGGVDVQDFRRPAAPSAGAVVLFTGLSGAGKSTIARALVEHLHAHTTRSTVLLDGDDVRRELAGELGFGRDDRDRNLQRIAWVAARIAEVGGVAVCAPIAPFAASRDAMRAKVEPASSFFVVYVSTPIEVAESRDRKGLYAKARAGLIPDFTGIDSAYEAPTDAELVLDTSRTSVEACVAEVMRMLARRGVVGTKDGR
jgi:sulfate adenylyltransferase